MDFYKFNLNTCKYPPSETCTAHELEQICVERLQLYRIMDSANNLEFKPNTRKWEEYVEQKIVQNKLTTYIILLKDEECLGLIRARKNNHISHWLLSLCYCRSNVLKEFFMCCELYWFVMVYKRMKQEELMEFLEQNDFSFVQVSQKEIELFKDKLMRRNTEEIAFNNINLDNINEIAKLHYPLCMKVIHDVLRKEHHLKYDCKMQYGIFLKCLGLSYEDAMVFWKTEFTKKINQDWFDRKYAYLFKHQYGKVGGMIQYRPYSCDQILNNCPHAGQYHGCPFKHWDIDKLLQKCEDNGLEFGDINDIRTLVTNNKFKEACTVYFYGSHKVIRGDIISSPNEYFEKSYEIESSLDKYFDTILESCETEHF
ncbi:hypothetical protein NQ314_006012 [Rhamnusium bicolor]|uniref:DNA primase large subunit C-terminal domain-containing protein n=1 Tax=Rhamnusium bicolor TaxID=1586634 RepID=A0AAV8ZD04_9CUCU|nr:hypothetical protein NQ314_006012 [Rhamnusium bicolor]